MGAGLRLPQVNPTPDFVERVLAGSAGSVSGSPRSADGREYGKGQAAAVLRTLDRR